MSLDSEDMSKASVSIWMIVRIGICLFVLPFTAAMLGVDTITSIIGVLFGGIVFAFVVRRLRRDSPFPLKAVLISVIGEAVALMLLALMSGQSMSVLSVGYPLQKMSSFLNSDGSIRTMSVILPCANEGVYAVNTARSIGELTPKSVLVEIIVVDDGSTTPLEDFFRETAPELLEQYPIKFVRHETFTGLINAKKQGGDRAIGDVLTFLDCHVLPRDYGVNKSWADGIMARIAGNYKRVVVPSITDLDADKWEEIGKPKGVAKCYLSLDVDFRWFDSDDDYIPIMSGGLLAMSRQWWIETGGYDAGMVGWGGENIDQSLRIWLCGGEIVQATDSHVAHMWRTNAKPQTKAKYTVPEGAVNTNRYRVALAWMDEYLAKVNEYPIFTKWTAANHKPLPDVSSILAVRHDLQCQPFQWFIDRFAHLYFGGGILPEKVFRIRDAQTNVCLARRNIGDRNEHQIVVAACSTEDNMQVWHRGNRNSTSKACCAGLRSYDSMYCLAGGAQGKARGNECNIHGMVMDQYVDVTIEGKIFFEKSKTCLHVSADPNNLVTQATCDHAGVLNQFEMRPDAKNKNHHLLVEVVTGKCVTAYSSLGEDGENEGTLELTTCDPQSELQLFEVRRMKSQPNEVFQLITWENLCLDSADGKETILGYPCYEEATNNVKQMFSYDSASRTIKNVFHPTCLSATDNRVVPNPDGAARQRPLAIAGCVVWDGVVKSEQRFKTIRLEGASEKSGVLIQSTTDNECLSADGTDEIALVSCPTDLDTKVPHKKLLWSFEGQSRIRNLGTNKCLDGNDHKKPILYPCYDSDNDNQEWTDPGSDAGGIIKNSRASMCLDFHPLPERNTSVHANCKTANHKWEMHDPQESREYQIYKASHEKAPVVN